MTQAATLAGSRDANPPRTAVLVLGLVALYAALIYLPFLGAGRTLTSHEVMVTHPAQRVLADGQWIVPRYASGYWLDKPPLVIWLNAASLAVLGGFSEFAARLPAALSAIGLCVLMAALAYRFLGPPAALLAGLVQATCVYMYMQGRLGEIDIILTLLIAGAHAVLALYWGRGRLDLPWQAAAAFHALAALAVLAKGIIAVALIGCTILAFCIMRRSWRPLRAVVLTPGILCFFALVVPWHVAAYGIAGQEALQQWRYNGLLRFFGLHHLGSKSPVYYFYTVPWLFLPWTFALLIGYKRVWRDARGPQACFMQFLWAWFLGGFVLLTISLFKHKHYIIPILPPLSILATGPMLAHIAAHGVHAKRFYAIVFVVLLLVYGYIGGWVMPARDHRVPTVEFVQAQTGALPEDQRLYIAGLGQSSVYPSVAHDNVYYTDDLDEIDRLLDQAGPEGLLLMTLHQRLSLPAAETWSFTPQAAEPVREKYPLDETLVIGRLTRSAAPATVPTTRETK